MKRWLAAFLFAVMVGLVVCISWLSSTQPGLAWLIDRLAPSVQVGEVEGTLLGPLTLNGVRYSNEQQTLTLDSVSLSWQPARLITGNLVIDELTISGVVGTSPETSASSPGGQFSIPVDVEAKKITIDQARWNATVLEHASATASIHDNILKLDALKVQLPAHTLVASGVIDLSQSDRGIVRLKEELVSKIDEDTHIQGTGTIDGTWQELNFQHSLSAPYSTTIKGTLLNASKDNRDLQADLTFQRSEWPSFSNIPIDGQLNLRGSISSFVIEGQLTGNVNGKDSALNLAVAAADSGLSINKFELTTSNDSDIPASPSLLMKGSIENYSALLNRELNDASMPTDTTTKSELKLDLQWFDDRWQALLSNSTTSSPSGLVSITGNLNDYRAKGTAKIDAQSDALKTSGTINFSGGGDTTRFQFDRISMDGALGQLNGSANLDWKSGLEWQAKLSFDKLVTETFLQDWPGMLSGLIDTQGRIATDTSVATVNLNNVSGVLKQQPFKADGKFALVDQRTDIQQLAVSLGASQLSINGQIDNQSNASLTYTLNSPDLAIFSPNLAGAVDLKGQITGSLSNPSVIAAGNASNIRVQDWFVQNVAMDINLSVASKTAPWKADIIVDGLVLNDQTLLDQGVIKLDGTADRHNLSVNTKSTIGIEQSAELSAQWRDNSWQGSINEFSISDNESVNFKLDTAATFSVSQARQSLQELCLNDASATPSQSQTERPAICLGFDNQKQSTNLSATTQQLSTGPFRQWLAAYGLELDTHIDSDITVSALSQDWTSATINARISGIKGSIRRLGGEFLAGADQADKLDFSKFEISLASAGASTFSLSANLQNDASVSANFKVDAPLLSNNFNDAQLSGTIQSTVPDLAVFSALYPSSMTVDGDFLGNFDLSGSLNQVALMANMTLNKGAIRLPELGIDLVDVTFNIDAASPTATALRGSAVSGTGLYQFDGNLNLADLSEISGQLSLTGDKVLLIQSPTMSADGDLDLTVVLKDRRAHVSGSVTIAQANIGVGSHPSVITESADVVFDDIPVKQRGILTSINIKLDLGQNTRIDTSGLTGKLRGTPRIKLSADNELTAVGKLTLVDGQYRAYGQDLAITKGDINYAGGAIDDPNLAIEVSRKVKGNQVGLSITGRAAQPQVALFSSPTLNDQDILSMLVFSKPVADLGSSDGLRLLSLANSLRGGGQSSSKIDQMTDRISNIVGVENVDIEVNSENDQTSLGIRSQITSAFSIAYGYNFINSIRTLILSYKLNQRWSIQSTIDTESGVDFTYQIERD